MGGAVGGGGAQGSGPILTTALGQGQERGGAAAAVGVVSGGARGATRNVAHGGVTSNVAMNM